MTKTELTKTIEEAIQNWHPASSSGIVINKMRPEHTALEVPVICGSTEGGIIDAVRVSEYFSNEKPRRICSLSKWRKDGLKVATTCEKGKDTTGRLDKYCDVSRCRFNGVEISGEPQILISCFEIKVTKSDFKSSHGHNFVGNLNYYVVPQEIYADVRPMVSPDIGILVFYHKDLYWGLRIRKIAEFRSITDEDQKWLILSVLKRIRDMDQKYFYDKLSQRTDSSDWI